MAVEYGGQATEAPVVQNYVTPKDGVQDKSGEVLMTGLTGLFEKATDMLKKKKEGKADAIISEFASKQLLIAEGLEQGTISSSAYARSLARKNLLEAISANPTLAKDLIAADGSLTSLPGGTGEVRDGTEEEKREAARKTQLVTAGIMPSDATDEEFKTYDEIARTAEESERRFKTRMDTLDLQLKTDTLAENERKRLEDERAAEVSRYVTDNVPVAHQMVKLKFEEILTDTALTEADKVVAIEEYYNQWLAETSGTLGELDAQKSQYMLKPFEQLRDLYVKRATGELGDAEIERSTKRILELQKSLALADPDIARAATLTGLMGQDAVLSALISGTKPVNDAYMRYLAGNSDKVAGVDNQSAFVKLPDEKKALKAYLNTVTLGLNSNDEAVKAESEGHIKTILKGLEDYEGLIRSDPTKAIEVVNWLASPSFIEARNANPELFAETSGAVDVLTRHYADEVWGMVSREFINSDVIVEDLTGGANSFGVGKTEAIPATEGIGVRTTAAGMEFYSIDPKAESEIFDEVRRLNKELKPVINGTVKAFAHLDGRTDYGKVWEEGASQFLGETTSGGDTDDNLVLSSYATNLGDVEPLKDGEVDDLTATSGLVSGGKMDKVEGFIVHHTGGRGTVEGVVQTLKDRGLSVQYVIDREGGIHQLMADDDIAYHAGKNNSTAFTNKNSAGVEIIANDDSDILPVQVEAAKSLIKTLAEKHGFDPKTSVFGHGEVATHKQATEGGAVIKAVRG